VASQVGGILFTRTEVIRVIKIKEVELGRTSSTYGEDKNVYNILVGKPYGKRQTGKPTRRWGKNIKMVLTKIAYESADWF
jgi:hypothetical protein